MSNNSLFHQFIDHFAHLAELEVASEIAAKFSILVQCRMGLIP